MIVERLSAGLVTLGLLAGPAWAQDLRVGIGHYTTSADPHFYNNSPNNAYAAHIYDRLIDRSATVEPIPGLATSWRPVTSILWELKLREGVTWHDGRPFTADDVAFSFTRARDVPNSTGGFRGFLRMIERVEVVDPLTIHFHLTQAHPLLPRDLTNIAIVSRHAGEGATTADYNAGTAAIGTGPYRFRGYQSASRYEFTRNDGYWGGTPAWRNVTFRAITSDPARSAALLAGDVDVIDKVPTSDIARLRRDPRIGVAEIQGLRVIYLQSDMSRTGEVPFVTDNAGTPLPRNPFLDLRVRRALSLAIDRQALADRVMEGTAQPNGQWLPPGTFGYNPEVAAPRPDPEGARRLLAEAGFPQGFRLTFHTPNDRYPNDARVAQAVAQMWTRVGIGTTVEALPTAAFAPRNARQDFAMRLGGWGSSSGEASVMITHVIGTYDRQRGTGANNNGRYSNPALDDLTRRAMATEDDAAREALLRDAVKMAMDDVALIPLFQLTNFWATRRDFVIAPRMDEQTTAMGVTRAPQ
ncbi:ABC transporter substrate-binding protein [Roseococcus sp.]|uniref:ABC transporter substrate-binding protein n=1 Tax=Roseococcus sp. TaxID=2109646 RepID=UPI003BAC3EF1